LRRSLRLKTLRLAVAPEAILVQLSGPGYQGDPWIPAMVAEAGFRYPVAMTTTAFCSYVSPLKGDGAKLAPCQDIKGRLWDVLWMFKLAIRRTQAPRDVLHFSLRVVPNVGKGDRSNLCEAPGGPFRQIGPVLFSARELLAKVKYAVACTSGFGDFTY
jgi:hypothetical protein